MKGEVIIACDFSSKEATLNFLDQFKDVKPFVKIGMELYYAEGPEIVREIKNRGHKIFLDLKLHDIPNTVKSAMKNLARLGVDMVNVHAAGTVPMMKAAMEGLIEGTKEGGKRPLCIAVTQLTSISQETLEKELLINHPLNDVVKTYALNAKSAGLDGVVCSPLEAPIIKELGLKDVTLLYKRAEDASKEYKESFDIVTARAVARLNILTEIVSQMVIQ